MAAAKKHTLLELAGAGIAAFIGYEYVYKPWAANQAAVAAGTAAAAATGTGSFFAPLSSLISAPTTTTMPAAAAATIGASIGDHRITPGGPTGYAMWLKGWSQDQAHDRLIAEQTGYNNAMQAIANLQNTANPAAADLPAAQAALQAEQAALSVAQTAYQQLMAAGNTQGAATYAAAISGHQNDIAQLQARIAAAGQAVDNSAAITTWQSAAATFASQFAALTGGMPVTTPVN